MLKNIRCGEYKLSFNISRYGNYVALSTNGEVAFRIKERALKDVCKAKQRFILYGGLEGNYICNLYNDMYLEQQLQFNLLRLLELQDFKLCVGLRGANAKTNYYIFKFSCGYCTIVDMGTNLKQTIKELNSSSLNIVNV